MFRQSNMDLPVFYTTRDFHQTVAADGENPIAIVRDNEYYENNATAFASGPNEYKRIELDEEFFEKRKQLLLTTDFTKIDKPPSMVETQDSRGNLEGK